MWLNHLKAKRFKLERNEVDLKGCKVLKEQHQLFHCLLTGRESLLKQMIKRPLQLSNSIFPENKYFFSYRN